MGEEASQKRRTLLSVGVDGVWQKHHLCGVIRSFECNLIDWFSPLLLIEGATDGSNQVNKLYKSVGKMIRSKKCHFLKVGTRETWSRKQTTGIKKGRWKKSE